MVIFWAIRDKIRMLYRSIMRNSSTRVLGVMSASILVFLLFLLVYSYNSQLDMLRTAELDRLQAIVHSTALAIDGDAHEMLTFQLTDEGDVTSSTSESRYEKTHSILRSAASENGLTSDLYTLIKEGDELQFAVTSGENPYYRHVWTEAHIENVEQYELGAAFGPYEDEHGTWLSAFAPIRNSSGQTVAILQADSRFDEFITATRMRIGRNLLIVLLAIGIMNWFMIKAVMRILKKETLLHDRIIEQNKTIRHAQEETLASIHYAKNIQFATLPGNELMSDVLGGEFFVLFKPRDIVSGDFYWVHQRGEKRYFAVADCTGHGVPGAFMSLIGNTSLTNIMADPDVETPAQILERLDEEIRSITSTDKKMGKDGMDIGLIMYDPTTSTITFSGANRPLLHLRNGELTKIDGSNRGIGGGNVLKSFDDKTVEVIKGDRLYMYSDGYADQFGGEKDKKYYSKRLRSLITETQDLEMSDQRYLYNYEFHLWKEEKDQVDDVLLAGLEIE